MRRPDVVHHLGVHHPVQCGDSFRHFRIGNDPFALAMVDVRRDGDVTFGSDPFGNFFDMIVDAKSFLNYDHARIISALLGLGHVGVHSSIRSIKLNSGPIGNVHELPP